MTKSKQTTAAPKKGKDNSPVKPASVWLTHQNRTCIVIDVVKDVVTYIPIVGDEPLSLGKASVQDFVGNMFVRELPEYPIERAARLFIEFSRGIGATDEALDALGKLTTVTTEERDMAQAKRAAAAGKAATKAPAGGKKAAAAPKEKKPRGPSAASMFMELIMDKGANGECSKSDDQIFAAVQKKFDLDDSKRTYVSWYRNKLRKDGENPPPPKGGEKPARSRGRPAATDKDKAAAAPKAKAAKKAKAKPAKAAEGGSEDRAPAD